jgi:hypothetical protein
MHSVLHSHAGSEAAQFCIYLGADTGLIHHTCDRPSCCLQSPSISSPTDSSPTHCGLRMVSSSAALTLLLTSRCIAQTSLSFSMYASHTHCNLLCKPRKTSVRICKRPKHATPAMLQRQAPGRKAKGASGPGEAGAATAGGGGGG